MVVSPIRPCPRLLGAKTVPEAMEAWTVLPSSCESNKDVFWSGSWVMAERVASG